MRLAALSEKEIIITLIALALLLLFAFCFGTLMEKIKGPRVVGEILGGMILGGSCLFLLLPSLSEQVFFAYPEEGKVLNGDLVISLDTVFTNADKFSRPYDEELHRVIIHGILHLCGINDKGPGEREIMEAAEEKALAMR